MKRFSAFCVALLALPVLAPSSPAHEGRHERIAAVTAQLRREPHNAELHLKRAELYRLHRAWRAALADYARAEKLSPAWREVEFCRGRMWLDAGQVARARAALDRFLRQRPEHAEALFLRARALARLHRPAAAAADYTRAIGLLPRAKPDQYVARAEVLAAAGDTHIAEALRGLDEGITQLGPLVTLLEAAVKLELKRRNWDAALARLDSIAAQSSRREGWLARRGEILLRAGRNTEAHTSFAAALRTIEALPLHLRRTQAMVELERRVRTVLN